MALVFDQTLESVVPRLRRSQKVTIMRDRVLITPAPYSAPAAYYIPNVSRIASVEVLKGPAATAYGPHTVGGAINLASPSIPEGGSEGSLISAPAQMDITRGRSHTVLLRGALDMSLICSATAQTVSSGWIEAIKIQVSSATISA